MEAYIYFDANVRPLPKASDGSIDKTAPGYVDNDVDAFRHTYVSGRFLQIYNEKFAMLLGWLNEIAFPSSTQGTNMDLWNNAVGRELARKHKTKQSLAKAVHEALQIGRLITYPGDARVYTGSTVNKPAGDYSIVVLKRNKGGGNELYFDFNTGSVLTKKEFTDAIKQGIYPAYGLRSKDGEVFPVTKRNKSTADNLG
ncbi:MAG: hypothetical protein NTY08_17165 [Proteobacteria bacterium]|nr:hypothetical protein [Pseudomonadota bacterium]